MFLDFYGLREQPFGVTPDPTYLYLSLTHHEALAALLERAERGERLYEPTSQGEEARIAARLQNLRARSGPKSS